MPSSFRYRVSWLSGALIATALLLAAPAAQAQVFFQNTTGGLDSPATTITFDEVPLQPFVPVTNQFAPFGVTFSGLFPYIDQTGITTVVVPILANFDDPALRTPFSIFFTTPQNRAAFAVLTNNGTTTFTALNNGVEVARATATTTTRLDNFFGFTGGTFNEIRVFPGGNSNAALIDNVQFGSAPPPVPEPSAWAGMGMASFALCGLMVRARRKGKNDIGKGVSLGVQNTGTKETPPAEILPGAFSF